MYIAARLIGAALSVVSLIVGAMLFVAHNDLTPVGILMVALVTTFGVVALPIMFLAEDLPRVVRLGVVGAVAGMAALFAFGAFGPIIKTDYVGLYNAAADRAERYYTDRLTLQDCDAPDNDTPQAITIKTDGYVCEVTYDREHNGITVILHGDTNLNNTSIYGSKDFRTTTLAFPVGSTVDFFLYNEDKKATPMPEWVLKRGGDGHTYRDGATHYMLARNG